MSQPEHQAILEEIRSARITASQELRTRVRELAASRPPAPPGRGRWWRRPVVVLLPAAVAVAVATAVAVGVLTSRNHSQPSSARREATPPAPFAAADQAQKHGAVAPRTAGGSGAAGSVPATRSRAQLYESELTIEVANLSDATKRALRLTRGFHGYVRSVDYGSGTQRGSAYLALRVPVGSVQAAIVEFSALGEILDQHVSIRDVQPTVDRRFRRMQSVRDSIARIQARLGNPALSAEERQRLESKLVTARRALVVLQRQQAALRRQASYATVELALRTPGKAVVVPPHPNRIERALDRSGAILLDELEVVLYVLIVGAPLLALAALALGGGRTRRRRMEERLLSTS